MARSVSSTDGVYFILLAGASTRTTIRTQENKKTENWEKTDVKLICIFREFSGPIWPTKKLMTCSKPRNSQ